jgi:hypothetical protein
MWEVTCSAREVAWHDFMPEDAAASAERASAEVPKV